ncbi:hypothetical protein [Microbacterium sp.]|uniref:hypothetical protein n=1 Tax=Microbacterium sp. TaxID=51671 RepID=UPI0035650976
MSSSAVSAETTSNGGGGTDAVDDSAPDCVVCGAPVKRAVKVSGPVLIQKKFVKYLTEAWARSTGYSWNSSTTVSATVSAGLGVSGPTASSNIGVSGTVTKSYSITVNIAASSTRYSKLGLASNYNKYGIKTAYHQDGKPVPGATWTYGSLYAPTKDQYLIVHYQ